jgi:hypothetical protein
MVGTIGWSVGGEYVGGRGSVVTGWGIGYIQMISKVLAIKFLINIFKFFTNVVFYLVQCK